MKKQKPTLPESGLYIGQTTESLLVMMRDSDDGNRIACHRGCGVLAGQIIAIGCVIALNASGSHGWLSDLFNRKGMTMEQPTTTSPADAKWGYPFGVNGIMSPEIAGQFLSVSP